MLSDRIIQHYSRRLWLLGVFFTCAFGVLSCRLWQVQLRHAEKYDEDVSRQSVRRIVLEPVRGRIFAADGATVLVDNRVCYDLIFHPGEMRRPASHGKGSRTRTMDYILERARFLAEKLRRPVPLTDEPLRRHLDISPAMGIRVFQDLTPAEVAVLAELAPPIPGMEIMPRIVRTYPHPGVASHILGFTGKQHPAPSVDAEGEAENAADGPLFAYLPPELVGRQGLERVCDGDLRGKAGEQLVRVDIRGYIHDEIGSPVPPQHGSDLILTLDFRAQKAAEHALRSLLAPTGQAGAMAVLDVGTGAVLAMASWPSYDLSSLTPPVYHRLATDRERTPLLNRAIAGSYQPGSIVKPLTALAVLQSNASSSGDTVTCTGVSRTGGIRCWKTGGHGSMDMVHALEQSCNCYFIEMGLRAGLDRLLPVFGSAGIGQETGIELGGATGFLPSRGWAEDVRRQPWSAADTAYLSIGQGPVTLSPLQAAMYTAAIANGGTIFRPYLVRMVRAPDGTPRRQTAPVGTSHLPAMQTELSIIRRGMYDVVNGANATAAAARNPFITLAGKTGTAEVGTAASARHKNTWFIGYAPAESPKYALAIVVERGQSGGHTASPIAKTFFESWLGGGEIKDTPEPPPAAAPAGAAEEMPDETAEPEAGDAPAPPAPT